MGALQIATILTTTTFLFYFYHDITLLMTISAIVLILLVERYKEFFRVRLLNFLYPTKRR